jgi:hypothetical protein
MLCLANYTTGLVQIHPSLRDGSEKGWVTTRGLSSLCHMCNRSMCFFEDQYSELVIFYLLI